MFGRGDQGLLLKKLDSLFSLGPFTHSRKKDSGTGGAVFPTQVRLRPELQPPDGSRQTPRYTGKEISYSTFWHLHLSPVPLVCLEQVLVEERGHPFVAFFGDAVPKIGHPLL